MELTSCEWTAAAPAARTACTCGTICTQDGTAAASPPPARGAHPPLSDTCRK